MRTRVQPLASLSGLRIRHCLSCGVGHRCGLYPALLWLWCRQDVIALIGPLAWEPPYAASVALKRPQKEQRKKKNPKNKKVNKNKIFKKPTSHHSSKMSPISHPLKACQLGDFPPSSRYPSMQTSQSKVFEAVFIRIMKCLKFPAPALRRSDF